MKLLLRYTTLPSVMHVLSTNTLTLLRPSSWEDLTDRKAMEYFSTHSRRKTVVALCMTEAEETFHHWFSFGKSGGACLVLDKRALVGLIEALNYPSDPDAGFRIAPVTYEEIDGTKTRREVTVPELPFMKQDAYKDEREWRLIYYNREDIKESVEIPIEPYFVRRVIIDPWLPSPLFKTVHDVLRSFVGYENLEIVHSNIINNQAFLARASCAREVTNDL